MAHRFRILDVFAERTYAGNQLAVIEDAGDLTDEEMAAVAAEMDYSETTFLESTTPHEGSWPTRIFTPEGEIPFAGHPTLGTAWTVREHLAEGTPETVTLDLPVGEVPVRWEDGDEGKRTAGSTDDPDPVPTMTQRPPTFGEELPHEDLAAALSLSVDDLDTAFPVQVVSTGLPTIVVPLRDRAALERATIDRAAYDRVVEGREAKNVLAFCADPREDRNDLADRVFAPAHGVPEDPATGSSNGCLAAYLLDREFFDPPVEVAVEQGYEMGRPSRLSLSARREDGEIRIEVGGRVVPVAEGTLL
jgi:trans-2,3-dihydro-3-hydroxyanthranilate isomerase